MKQFFFKRIFLNRSVLHDYCVTRRSLLVEDFITALTRGGPAGNPAPIELRVHDPQIYTTDIFVWINKAVLAEKQNLQLLLKFCNKLGKRFSPTVV